MYLKRVFVLPHFLPSRWPAPTVKLRVVWGCFIFMGPSTERARSIFIHVIDDPSDWISPIKILALHPIMKFLYMGYFWAERRARRH